MKVTIVIPTYNEAGNIADLVSEIFDLLDASKYQAHVLVVDDDSPDGTQAVVEKCMESHPQLYLITGDKNGLGNAYKRGIAYALGTLKSDIVMQMDADFSHAPKDIPRLLEIIDQGADFVIGSRYVEGGAIPINWGTLRRWNSRIGNWVARFAAGIEGVNDCTAGFRAIRASLLRQIKIANIPTNGYAFQISLLFAAARQNAKVAEVPVAFIDRTKGDSKLGWQDILEFLVAAVAIRVRKSATLIKFGIVGASGVLVNVGCFALLLSLGANKYVASPIAVEISILWNFWWNNKWTFRWRKPDNSVSNRALMFNAASLVTLAISFGSFVTLSWIFPTLHSYLVQALSILPAALLNYIINSLWTFRDAVHERID